MATRKPNKKENGAAMLVVMLVLLMTTATAIFAVHATQYEIRGAGAGRQGLQTQYVGESGAMAAVQYIDDPGGANGARGILNLMSLTVVPANFMRPFFEPELLPNKGEYRLYLTDFTARSPSNWPIETDPTRGPSLGRTYISPNFIVDLNDNYTSPATIAGARADGRGLLYANLTVTSHGRTDVNADYRNATFDTRLYHEGASDARAYLVVGPF